MTEPSHAVFLSYASQDAEAAQRICEALRAAGIEVWFDQSELRGGDAWDQSIRKQIKTCALFIPVISRHTHERREGYFRLEWNLALDRSRLISTTQVFFVPVVIDDTREDDEEVPEKIRDIHWTRLPGGVTPAAFVERVQRLLSGETSTTTRLPPSGTVPAVGGRTTASRWSRHVLPAAGIVAVLGAVAYLAVNKPWSPTPATAPATASAAPAAFAPPPHSVAVLPFVNMSGDKEQEYFSDGLTEELLNSLAEINELRVAARTSAFSFKGKDTDLGTIARRLNVGAILEGSVRRSGNTVRITVQLINAVTGFHMWSKSYDRNLGDVLKLQTEIATVVAGKLEVTLLSDVVARIEVGGTYNAAAFDAYLRAARSEHQGDLAGTQTAIAGYSQAVRLDPGYALAFAMRSIEYHALATEYDSTQAVVRDSLERARADAKQAISLAPDLAEGHLAQAHLEDAALNFTRANDEYERAVAAAPGDARVLRWYGSHAVQVGHIDTGLKAIRHAAALDPLNPWPRNHLAVALLLARRYQEALDAMQDARSLAGDSQIGSYDSWIYYLLGDFRKARELCIARSDKLPEYSGSYRLFNLALIEHKLGRHAEAEAMLAKLRVLRGDDAAYDYARVYAQWGDSAKALEWLETALRLRDPGLGWVNTDPFIDPLRQEPRFKAVMRELKFPD